MHYLIIIFIAVCQFVNAASFTIASYNAGGLDDHYDYLRAIAMESIMEQRADKEPEKMQQNVTLEQLATILRFSQDPYEKQLAKKQWQALNADQLFQALYASPFEQSSINYPWYQLLQSTITDYKTRPIKIHNDLLFQKLLKHMKNLCVNHKPTLENTRDRMAKQIFKNALNYDIICLQENQYIKKALFPSHYEILSTPVKEKNDNAIVWNSNRFELIDDIGDISGHAYAAKFKDKTTKKVVLIVSAHLTGCNPYKQELINGYFDSKKGDNQLQQILRVCHETSADMTVVGLDSNVTAFHPRLSLFSEKEFKTDYKNFIEPTCSGPYQIMSNKLDWIFIHSKSNVNIINIPINSIELNNMETNISDHKPIAARVIY